MLRATRDVSTTRATPKEFKLELPDEVPLYELSPETISAENLSDIRFIMEQSDRAKKRGGRLAATAIEYESLNHPLTCNPPEPPYTVTNRKENWRLTNPDISLLHILLSCNSAEICAELERYAIPVPLKTCVTEDKRYQLDPIQVASIYGADHTLHWLIKRNRLSGELAGHLSVPFKVQVKVQEGRTVISVTSGFGHPFTDASYGRMSTSSSMQEIIYDPIKAACLGKHNSTLALLLLAGANYKESKFYPDIEKVRACWKAYKTTTLFEHEKIFLAFLEMKEAEEASKNLKDTTKLTTCMATACELHPQMVFYYLAETIRRLATGDKSLNIEMVGALIEKSYNPFYSTRLGKIEISDPAAFGMFMKTVVAQIRIHQSTLQEIIARIAPGGNVFNCLLNNPMLVAHINTSCPQLTTPSHPISTALVPASSSSSSSRGRASSFPATSSDSKALSTDLATMLAQSSSVFTLPEPSTSVVTSSQLQEILQRGGIKLSTAPTPPLNSSSAPRLAIAAPTPK